MTTCNSDHICTQISQKTPKTRRFRCYYTILMTVTNLHCSPLWSFKRLLTGLTESWGHFAFIPTEASYRKHMTITARVCLQFYFPRCHQNYPKDQWSQIRTSSVNRSKLSSTLSTQSSRCLQASLMNFTPFSFSINAAGIAFDFTIQSKHCT